MTDGVSLFVIEPSIGLVDRTNYLFDSKGGSQSNYSTTMGQRGTASITLVISGSDPYSPQVGWPVRWRITVGGVTTNAFAGTINSLDTKIISDRGDRYTILTLVSLEQVFDVQVMPAIRYAAGTTCGAIVTDVVSFVCLLGPVSGTTPSPGATLTSDLLITPGTTPAALFDQLALMSGYVWFVDPNSFYLIFTAPTAITAPTISDDATGKLLFDSIDWKQTRQNFRDRQIVQMSQSGVATSREHIPTGGSPSTTYATSQPVDTLLSASLNSNDGVASYIPLVFSGLPSDGDWIQFTATNIGVVQPAVRYTFKNTIDNTVPCQVKIGLTAAACVQNLSLAINRTLIGGLYVNLGTSYSMPTMENPDLYASYSGGLSTSILSKIWDASHTLSVLISSSVIGGQFIRSVTLNHAKCGTADTTNFVAFVSMSDATLKSTVNGGNVGSASGFDIRFWSDSGASVALSWEMDYYDPVNGVVLAWVNIPTLSHTTDTVIYVTYGNATITTFQGTTPWTGNIGVYHFRGPTASGAGFGAATADSGTLGSSLSFTSVTAVDGGFIDGAVSLNGTSSVAINGAVAADVSIVSCWVKPASASGTQVVWQAPTDNSTLLDLVLYSNGSDWNFKSFNPTDSSGGTAVSTGTVAAGSWQYIVGVHDSAAGITRIYVNGVQGTDGAGATATGFSTQASDWGKGFLVFSSTVFFFGGLIDEGRVFIASATSSHVTSDYNSQNSPGTFLTIGSQSATATSSVAGTSASTITSLTVGKDVTATKGSVSLTMAVTPPANHQLEVSYYRFGAEYIYVENTDLVNTRATVEHASGWYMVTVTDSSNANYPSIITEGTDLLTKYGVLPDQVQLNTYINGIVAGASLTISITTPVASGLLNGMWQVQSVQAQYMPAQPSPLVPSMNSCFLYTLTLVSSTVATTLKLWEQMMTGVT